MSKTLRSYELPANTLSICVDVGISRGDPLPPDPDLPITLPFSKAVAAIVSLVSILLSFILLSLTPSLPLSPCHSFIRSFVHSFIRSFVRSFLQSFVRSFSFVPSFLRSFVPSFTCRHQATAPEATPHARDTMRAVECVVVPCAHYALCGCVYVESGRSFSARSDKTPVASSGAHRLLPSLKELPPRSLAHTPHAPALAPSFVGHLRCRGGV